ncbi:hypothetical protein [Naasia aerilata]|uniref:Sugar phosphate isomerase/epimerase n=1 Tax=Naasia aerilata TaxID=1162966 RepID=A0ABM8GHC2_9MICO|nr:hypothetical protein [Naasia aerilata]BDZ44132.1 hypothetical protein GCM10025866_00410 [Naasia aerilata]BDZ47743.1 hypothetical protein GCM10025866_36520 [Naasia aerilata]
MTNRTDETRWATTLYSFTNELMSGSATPDELVGEVVESGVATAVEVDGAQHFPTFPDISADDAARTRDAYALAGATPTMLGIYADIRIDRRGPRSPDEQREFVLRQLEAAATVGFFGARVGLGALAPDLVVSLVPDLERLGVRLLEEVQGGARPDSPAIDRHRELRSRLGTDALGFVFDSSLVMAGFPVTWRESLLASGATDRLLDATEELWREGGKDAWSRVRELAEPHALSSAALRRLEMPFRRFGCSSVGEWAEFLAETDSVHLKYWDLEDDDERVSAPTRAIRKTLASAGYTGYICSEWGGHDWLEADTNSAFDMTRRHRDLFDPCAPVVEEHPAG